jgi:uncharacterized protein
VSRLKEILRKKKERRAKLLSSVNRMTQEFKNLGALKIIIFGSVARGDIDTNSDLDLLVIMPSHKTGREWTNIIYEKIERKIAADFIVYNEQEFLKKRSTSRFLQDITRGKVAYEKAV